MMISHHVDHSINRWGGSYDTYKPIHTFLDLTKVYLSDWRHRLLLHNTLGVSLVGNIFEDIIIGKKTISSRVVAEHHILEDLGVIPTTEWMLRDLKVPKLDLVQFESILKQYFTKEEIEFLLLFYYQAKDKAIIYYSTLGLELLNIKFSKYNLDRYVEGLIKLSGSSYLNSPADYLITIPIERWMGGLSPHQVKYINKVK